MSRWITLLLRLEAAAVFTAATVAYHRGGGGLLPFALLFFVPDVAMLGYLRGPVLGARLYNAAHTYLAPALLAGVALVTQRPLDLALIWCAHIGFDRMLGYGLKLREGFTQTHLGSIGAARALEAERWPEAGDASRRPSAPEGAARRG